MHNLDELSDGVILRSMSAYVLTQPVTQIDSDGRSTVDTGEIEIRVFKYLNGERKGQFQARPYIGFMYGAEEFIGRASTEEQALYDILGRIKDVPFQRIFPEAAV